MEEVIHALDPDVFWQGCAEDNAECHLLSMRSQEAVLEVPAVYEHVDPRTGAVAQTSQRVKVYVQRFTKDRERPRAHVICLSGGPGFSGRSYDAFISDMAYASAFPIAFYTIDHRGVGQSAPFVDIPAGQWAAHARAVAGSSPVSSAGMTLMHAALDVGMLAHALVKAARREWPAAMGDAGALPETRVALYGVSYGAQLAHQAVALLPSTFDAAFIIGVPNFDALGVPGTHLGLAENCAGSARCTQLMGCPPGEMLRCVDNVVRGVTDPARAANNRCAAMLLDEAGASTSERETQGGAMGALQRLFLPLMKNNAAVTRQKRGLHPAQLVLAAYMAAHTCRFPDTFERDVLEVIRPYVSSVKRTAQRFADKEAYVALISDTDVGPVLKSPGSAASLSGVDSASFKDVDSASFKDVDSASFKDVDSASEKRFDSASLRNFDSESLRNFDAASVDGTIGKSFKQRAVGIVAGALSALGRRAAYVLPQRFASDVSRLMSAEPKVASGAKVVFNNVTNTLLILNTDYNFAALAKDSLARVVSETNLHPLLPYRETYYERFRALESIVEGAPRAEQHPLRTARTTVVVSQSRMDMITPYDPAWRLYASMQCPRRYWMLFDHRGHDGNWGDCLRRAVHAVLFSQPSLMDETSKCLASENAEQHLEWDFPQHPEYASIWRQVAEDAGAVVSKDAGEGVRVARDTISLDKLASAGDDDAVMERLPSYLHEVGMKSSKADVYPPRAAPSPVMMPAVTQEEDIREMLSVIAMASLLASVVMLVAAIIFFVVRFARRERPPVGQDK